MAQKVPNPHSPEEVRRAFQQIKFDTAILSDGALGEILVGAGAGVVPTWTTSLTTLTLLTVDNITINAATITSDTGTVGFGDDNLTTTGTVSGVNVTSGNDPGHTHSIYSLVDGTRPFTGTVGGIDPVADTDLATKAYVDSISVSMVASAVIDNDCSTGHVLYAKATGNFGLAYADGADAWNAVGLADDDYSATDTATCVLSGPFTLANWANVTGTVDLTPGAVYYLREATGETTDYANDGGTGDRTGTITVTSTMTYASLPSYLVNGTVVETQFYVYNQTVAGKYIRFDFGAGISKLITEAKWYQSTTNALGTWQWQGSDDASSWTSIGSTFTLGGATEQTQTELSGNALGYRYYQLLGVSGTANSIPYLREIEFKIAAYSGNPYGQLTTTMPTDSPVVRIGTAVADDTLDIEIDHLLDHGQLNGLTDDDHTQYHNDTRAATWLAANHETTYNHANYDTAYGWGDHSVEGYLTAETDTLATVMGRGATTGTQLVSTLAIGTSPFSVTSTTVNTNLNADLWDGCQFADYLDQAVKTTSEPTFAKVTVDTISVDGNVISGSTGAISFSDEHLVTSGRIRCAGGSGGPTAGLASHYDISDDSRTAGYFSTTGLISTTGTFYHTASQHLVYPKVAYGINNTGYAIALSGWAFRNGTTETTTGNDCGTLSSIGGLNFKAGHYPAIKTESPLTTTCYGTKTQPYIQCGIITTYSGLLLESRASLATPAIWLDSHYYAANSYVRPSIANGYYYVCLSAGTSGGTEPVWSTGVNTTTNDNDIVWYTILIPSITNYYGINQVDASAKNYYAGKTGLGTTSPTAILHVKAGTATANTAPLKLTSGTLNTTAEAGAIEFLTDDFYATITSGAARQKIVLTSGLTSGKIPIATTNGRLTDGQTPLAGTKVYYVSDSSGGAVDRKLTFIDGILTAET